jgi:hypothetical protein
MSRLAQLGGAGDEAFEERFACVGTPEEIASDLRRRRELFGVSYVCVNEDVMVNFGPVVALLAGT